VNNLARMFVLNYAVRFAAGMCDCFSVVNNLALMFVLNYAVRFAAGMCELFFSL
jgi:hypothetical protein